MSTGSTQHQWKISFKQFFKKERRELRMNDFFTVNGLAQHFGVDPKTIYRKLWAKEIPAFKIGKQWRIAKKDLVWLKR